MISTNAAKIMGLYPRKGALAVGSDADIVLLETGIEKTIRAADLHETDYTPWEGHVVTAWPAATILRGAVVVEGGAFHGDLKDGAVPEAQGGRRDAQPAGGVVLRVHLRPLLRGRQMTTDVHAGK